jgi:hypothetical protein
MATYIFRDFNDDASSRATHGLNHTRERALVLYCIVGPYGTRDIVSNTSITKFFKNQNSDFVTSTVLTNNAHPDLLANEVRILIFDDPAEEKHSQCP